MGREVAAALPLHVSSVCEELVRESVLSTSYLGQTWGPSASWWGPGLDRSPLEIDVVAESAGGSELLVGEAKWQDRLDWPRAVAGLRQKAARLPLARGRTVRLAIWTKRPSERARADVACFTPRHVIAALR